MIAEVSVTPNSKRFSITQKDGRLKVLLRSPPENNKANIELVSELSKLLGRPVRIVSGLTSKKKRLAIDIDAEGWNRFLGSLP
jgi:uncharacterized protein (TIGR00251 family)